MLKKLLFSISLCMLVLFPAVIFADVLQTDDENFVNCLKTQLNITDRELTDEDIQSVNTLKCLAPVKPESLKKLKENAEFYCGTMGSEVYQSGIVVQSNVVYGTFVDDESFVPGVFYEDSFIPGITKDDTFIDGVFIENKFVPGKFYDGIFAPGLVLDGDFIMGVIKNGEFLRGNFIKDFRSFLPANLRGSKFGFSINLGNRGIGITRVNLGYSDLLFMRGHRFNPWASKNCGYGWDNYMTELRVVEPIARATGFYGGLIGTVLGLPGGPAWGVVGWGCVMIGFHGYVATRTFYDAFHEAQEEQNQNESGGRVHVIHNFENSTIENNSNTNDGPKENSPNDTTQNNSSSDKPKDNDSGSSEKSTYQGEPVCDNNKPDPGTVCPSPDGVDPAESQIPVVFIIPTLQPQQPEEYTNPGNIDPPEEDANQQNVKVPLPESSPIKPNPDPGYIDYGIDGPPVQGTGTGQKPNLDPGYICPMAMEDDSDFNVPGSTTSLGTNPNPVSTTGSNASTLQLDGTAGSLKLNNLKIDSSLNTQIQIGK